MPSPIFIETVSEGRLIYLARPTCCLEQIVLLRNGRKAHKDSEKERLGRQPCLAGYGLIWLLIVPVFADERGYGEQERREQIPFLL